MAYTPVSTVSDLGIKDIASYKAAKKKNSLLDYALTNEKPVGLDWLDDSEESMYAGGESFYDASGIGGESYDIPQYEAGIPEDLSYSSDYQWFTPDSNRTNWKGVFRTDPSRTNPALTTRSRAEYDDYGDLVDYAGMGIQE